MFFFFFLRHPTPCFFFFFFFNDTATTEIYTLSLHDALPISVSAAAAKRGDQQKPRSQGDANVGCIERRDRKSTRLNSSHANISYAVFCLKKKKKQNDHRTHNGSHAHHRNTLRRHVSSREFRE